MKRALLSLLALVMLASCGVNQPHEQAISEEQIIGFKSICDYADTEDFEKVSDYSLEGTTINAVYKIKEGDSVKAYGFEAQYDGYAIKYDEEEGDEFAVVYDVVFEGKVIKGIYIVNEAETKSVGSKLLKNTAFLAQFNGLEPSALADIDFQGGATAGVTLGGLRESLEKVSEFYLGTILNEEAEERDVTAGFKAIYGKDSITVTDITSSKTGLPASVTGLYEIKEGSDIKGYGFEVVYEGYEVKNDYAPNAEYPVTYDVLFDYETSTVKGIYIVEEHETRSVGGALLKNEEFLAQFKGLSLDGVDDVDMKSGPTAKITFNGLKNSLIKVRDYYEDNLKKKEESSTDPTDPTDPTPSDPTPSTEESRYVKSGRTALENLFGSGVTLENVTSQYSGYDASTGIIDISSTMVIANHAYNKILAIMKASDGGYGLIVETWGFEEGLYYALAVNSSGRTIGFNSFKNGESDEAGAAYLMNSAFLAHFNNFDLVGNYANFAGDVSTGATAGEYTKPAIEASIKSLGAYFATNVYGK